MTGYERVVNIDNVRKNNIVLVDLYKPLPKSVFEQEYYKAALIVREIIKNNRENSENRLGSFYIAENQRGFDCSISAYQTAIPFIGDRGTGKTSVMCSVLQRLANYNGGDGSEAFYLGKENEETNFVVLDMIDTNTLKNTEDVLEIILSRILSYLDRYPNKQIFRELYKKMDNLYKDLGQVYWKKTFAPDEPGIMGLKQITDSQRSIENFQILVEEFVKCVITAEHLKGRAYLVVALDDIDMYNGTNGGTGNNTFYLLEQIYNYMRIPQMIVLMTYNESILKRNCLSHFRNMYFDGKTQEDCTYAERLEIETLTRQFVTKLFPHEQRVYMPNFKRIHFAGESNLYINPIVKGEVIHPFGESSNTTPIRVKDFMLQLIAYKTGVYFDMAGSKKHFFEPRNLREFGAMFQIIDSMEDIPQEEEKRDEAFSRNRQILLNYLYNQFAGERLNSEEYMRFEALSMLPLIRQNRFLVDDIRQHRMLVASKEDLIGYLAKSGRDRWKYSYGELLHNLYFATRIPQNENVPEISFYSKAYIHCVLGTHSIIMNQSKYSTDEWMEMLGSSIAGRWANDMLPVFFTGSSQEGAALGSVSLPVRSFFNWTIPKNVQNALIKLSVANVNVSEKNTIKAFLKALTLLGMFFTRYPESGLRLKLVDEDKEDWSNEEPHQLNKEMFLYSATEEHVCFNAFNFVINLFIDKNGSCKYLEFIKAKLEKFGNTLGEIFKGSFKENWTAIFTELFGNKLMESSNFNEEEAVTGYFPQMIRQWTSHHRNVQFVLPVQHFDMMYNIIKRLANESYHDVPEEAPIEEVYDFFRLLYMNVEQELEKQDMAFSGNVKSDFAQTYRDSLFYKMFTAAGEIDPDGDGSIFRNIFKSTMEAALMPQYSRYKYTPLDFPFDEFLNSGDEND